MAILIDKKDLTDVAKAGVKVATATPVPTNTLSQITQTLDAIDKLLKNNIVQQLLFRIGGKFGLQAPVPLQPLPTPALKPNPANPNSNPETLYNNILQTIDMFLKLVGDKPLSEVKQYVIANKKLIVQGIKSKVKPV